MGILNWLRFRKQKIPEPTTWRIEKREGKLYRINTKTNEHFKLEEPEFERLLNIVETKRLSTTKAKKLFKNHKIQLSKEEVNEIIKPITKKHRRRH